MQTLCDNCYIFFSLSPAKHSPADEDGSSISNEEEGDNLSESFASAQGRLLKLIL